MSSTSRSRKRNQYQRPLALDTGSKIADPELDNLEADDVAARKGDENAGKQAKVDYDAASDESSAYSQSQSSLSLDTVLNGKDEMNLAEFPIARLGRSDNRLSIEYKGQITDKQGNVIQQRWIVSGNLKFGLPTEFADRVLVALMYITSNEHLKGDNQDKADRRVPFTIYRIIKLLGLSRNQRNYEAVEKALQQLVGVTIYSEDAFWDHKQRKRITTKMAFHILESFWLKSFEDDEPRPKDLAEKTTGYVVWGERIWDSFQAGYIKNLDVKFYYSLENTLARRLYRFLDKRMHYQETYQIDVFDLAARMGMKPYPFASHLVRKLKPAFDELKTQGFLESAEIVKVGDFTRVHFVRAGKQRRFAQVSSSTIDGVADEIVVADDEASEMGLDKASIGLAKDSTPHGELDTFATSAIPSQTAVESAEGDFEASRVQTITRDDSERSGADFEPSTQCRQLWAAVMDELQRTLPAAVFAMLSGSQLVSLEQHIGLIQVDPRYQQWLSLQMARQIKSQLNHLLEREQRIKEIRFIAL